MESNITDLITEDLTLDELGEIVQTSLALMYSKLRDDYAFGCDSRCVVTSIAADAYGVELIFVDGDRRNGINNIQVYQV